MNLQARVDDETRHSLDILCEPFVLFVRFVVQS
jgi:hypothetical protein